MLFKHWYWIRIRNLSKAHESKTAKIFQIFFSKLKIKIFCDNKKILSKCKFGQYFASFLQYDVTICLVFFMIRLYFIVI